MMRKSMLWAALACLGGLWTSGGPAGAAVYDPAWEWRTRETEHFRIHYPEALAADAERLARIAEEQYPAMTRLAGWEPEQLTEVTLVDDTDLANGSTTVFPYNRIVIYDVAPEAFSSISDSGDWLRLVFTHEYAHVLGLDYRRGYAKVLRYIFGRPSYPFTLPSALVWFLASPPNAFLPPWFHEGLAVNLETDLTGRGRKHSTYYDMIYRTDVAENAVPPLDRLLGDQPDWPSYSTRYIYGARLLALIADPQGDEGLGKLVRAHGGRFPYAIDAAPFSVAGKDYQGLYRDMTAGLERQYRPILDALSAQGLTPFRRLTREGGLAGGPVWRGGGELLYTRETPYGVGNLVALDLATEKETRLAPRPGATGRPALDPQGRVLYTRLADWRPYAGRYAFTDLYALPEGSFFSRRLTGGARLRDADAARDGRIAAVGLDGPRQRLLLLDDHARVVEILLDEPGVRYDHPRWSPDGTRLAFSRKASDGTERLAVYTLARREFRFLTPEGSRAGYPSWSPDGARIAFSWDRSGIFDLYEADAGAGGGIRRLTRLVGGAFWPEWSPDGKALAFVSYSSDGFDLALLDSKDFLSTPVDAAPPEELAKRREAAQKAPFAPPSAEVANSPAPGVVTAYAGADRLLPSSWLPDVFADNAGFALGAWTAATDPLDQQTYYAAGFWSPGLHRFYGLFAYVNDQWYPTLTLSGSKLPVPYADLLDGHDYWEENRTVGVELRQTLRGILQEVSLGVSYAYEDVTRLSRVHEDLDDRADLAHIAFEGRQNPLVFSLTYDSTFPRHTPFTLGPEGGRFLDVEYRLRGDATGSERSSREWVARWYEYAGLPWPQRATVALKGRGGLGSGDETAQSLFQAGGAASEFPLRGYGEREIRAERVAVGTAEIKLPLWQPYRGILDWAAFLSRLSLTGFYDIGRAYEGEDQRLRRGAGAELTAVTLLGYYFPLAIHLGYAHGFDEGGGNRGFLLFTVGGEEVVGSGLF